MICTLCPHQRLREGARALGTKIDAASSSILHSHSHLRIVVMLRDRRLSSSPLMRAPSPGSSRRRAPPALSPSAQLDQADRVARTSCKQAYYRLTHGGRSSRNPDEDITWICGEHHQRVTLDDVECPTWAEVMCTKCGATMPELESWSSRKYKGSRFVKCLHCNDKLLSEERQPPDGRDLYGPFAVYDEKIDQFRSWCPRPWWIRQAEADKRKAEAEASQPKSPSASSASASSASSSSSPQASSAEENTSLSADAATDADDESDKSSDEPNATRAAWRRTQQNVRRPITKPLLRSPSRNDTGGSSSGPGPSTPTPRPSGSRAGTSNNAAGGSKQRAQRVESGSASTGVREAVFSLDLLGEKSITVDVDVTNDFLTWAALWPRIGPHFYEGDVALEVFFYSSGKYEPFGLRSRRKLSPGQSYISGRLVNVQQLETNAPSAKTGGETSGKDDDVIEIFDTDEDNDRAPQPLPAKRKAVKQPAIRPLKMVKRVSTRK
ncbi:hypothetical protein AURDEDRAFT_164961 [Auricularia subglabra TFB-10046 SS5]|nr:hypothetical protein AURDEDRAFT_164961 [Auricularia subglabra TFB-10046 SS5]